MMKSGCTLSNKSSIFLGALVVLMLMVQQGSAGLYSCWGGCLNECFLLSSKKIGERFPCYVNCLAKCFSQPPGQADLRTPRLVNHPAPLHAPSPTDAESYSSNVIDKSSEIYQYHLHNCIKDCSTQTCWLASDVCPLKISKIVMRVLTLMFQVVLTSMAAKQDASRNVKI
ncbi:hypothetical protein L2E82_44893 [Cichorium intybus]|uniref:Uncharacterized protein n=1 Tax=Cichorium intybus TaxID=13427 RepID=A0ACB8ZSH2_CICIN|nr:hypothetical protein L2E82_44893 [Cichorium intybus]